MQSKYSKTKQKRLAGLRCLALGLIAGILGLASLSGRSANAQIITEPRNEPPARAVPNRFDAAEIARINAWTVGLAAGQLEGAPIRFATDIARVVDDGSQLHVLPIVTRGPTENVEALLYLKGVDVAIINSDTLEQFRAQNPNIQQRITYILSLFPSELHVFVGPGIGSLADLKGKKVNFNTLGTAAAYSGPLIFDKLKLGIQKTFIPHQIALQQMRAGQGDIAAVVFITSKPVDAFLQGKWAPGFKLLSVPFEDFSFYLPATLTSNDYPQLIPQGQEVQTIAVPTILAAFNWPKGSDRYNRVARLTDHLFSRLDMLQGPGFHPKWKDVVLNAKVPGLNRFQAAQDWLDRTPVPSMARAASRTDSAGVQPGEATLQPADVRLFEEFLKWRQQVAR
jgi:TRAP-type uncharacterized transport system substrate-binding protein